VREDPSIEVMTTSSTDPAVATRIGALREQFPGPLFAILDSDHRRDHVVAELELLRGATRPGDYVVVEDGNINGHPVLPGWGPGPYEAMEEYFARYPADYERDDSRESKFGFSFATRGFLVRR
jgi:cephalosporin hydroxylase